MIFSRNIPHLHCSREELKHCVESLDEGVEALEHERLMELPGTSRLPLVCEVGWQSYLVFLKGKVDELDCGFDQVLFPPENMF